MTAGAATPRPPSAAASTSSTGKTSFRRTNSRPASAASFGGLTTTTASAISSASTSPRASANTPSLSHSRTSLSAFADAKKAFARRLEEALAKTQLAAAARIADFIAKFRLRKKLSNVAKVRRDSNIASNIAAYRSECRKKRLRAMLSKYHFLHLKRPKRIVAAGVIQRAWRFYSARCVVAVVLRAARDAGRGRLVQCERTHRAAASIQALWRGVVAKRGVDLAGRRQRRHAAAAVVLQRWWRQRLVMCQARGVQRAVWCSEDGAARAIQRFLRFWCDSRRRRLRDIVQSLRSCNFSA